MKDEVLRPNTMLRTMQILSFGNVSIAVGLKGVNETDLCTFPTSVPLL